MTIDHSNDMYNSVKHLPFADGKFTATPKYPHQFENFKLSKTDQPVTLLNIHNTEIDQLPINLLKVLQDEFNYIIEEGKTYPHESSMNDINEFKLYWFKHFASILLQGTFTNMKDLQDDVNFNFKDIFLGTFYIKPNYIGRCSHVCNAGFIVNHEKRRLGLGKELGKKYLQIAPKLGYIYSVLNLVFETNIASLKIWDSLGFERIGYIKNVAVLKGNDDKLVGAYMFGKDLQ
ncbi:unnamed protein product [Candida verbasci]|uniref:N-acetyltransferase domain-containing protein n=1 Tax=Candida verbasci TaxID=1227364 RepID=A0A9W4X8B0_9ASCO|nr:unnamed protein product [Candida verbasci]